MLNYLITLLNINECFININIDIEPLLKKESLRLIHFYFNL